MGLFSWLGSLFGGGDDDLSQGQPGAPVNYKPGGTLMMMAQDQFKRKDGNAGQQGGQTQPPQQPQQPAPPAPPTQQPPQNPPSA